MSLFMIGANKKIKETNKLMLLAKLKRNKIKDGIMHKAQKNKPLTPRQKLINKLISKQRYIVEQCFGTLKRKFKFKRASYTTKRKVQAQFTFKAICSNLLKAANKVLAGKLTPIYSKLMLICA